MSQTFQSAIAIAIPRAALRACTAFIVVLCQTAIEFRGAGRDHALR